MFTLRTPAKILWEITKRCTRDCTFCYNGSSSTSTDVLDRHGREQILREILQANPLYVCITGGEPLLLDGELFETLEQLRAAGIFVELITNGDLVDEVNAPRLRHSCNLVTLPLLGADPEVHDAAIGPGSFAHVVKAVQLLDSVDVGIVWLLHRKNEHAFDHVLELLRGQLAAVRYLTIQPYVGHSRVADEDPLALSDSQLDDLVQRVVRLQAEAGERPKIGIADDLAEIQKLLRGRQFNYQACVEASGELLVHQWLPFSAGNMFQTGLAQAWETRLSRFWSLPSVKQHFRGIRSLQGIDPGRRKSEENFLAIDDFVNGRE